MKGANVGSILGAYRLAVVATTATDKAQTAAPREKAPQRITSGDIRNMLNASERDNGPTADEKAQVAQYVATVAFYRGKAQTPFAKSALALTANVRTVNGNQYSAQGARDAFLALCDLHGSNGKAK